MHPSLVLANTKREARDGGIKPHGLLTLRTLARGEDLGILEAGLEMHIKCCCGPSIVQ